MSAYKVAIIGAGPAGYFAAQALQNLQTDELQFSIDMIERLPTPWGLVRSGVAPDHPKIKTVSKVFEKVATAGNFRLFGNVELGTDISIEQLKEMYDAVVIATGSSIGKKLGIPGEDLSGSISAAEFVPWYNAHPDFHGIDVPLDCDTAVVIGAGNVAMDVARMLALEPSELDPTDTADHAIDAFKKSNIRKVYISARRGPEHAAFTSPELRELPKLEHTNVDIDKGDIEAAIVRAGDAPEKDVKSNLDAMLLIAENPKSEHERTMQFLFEHTPKEILGTDRVEGVVYSTPNGDVTIKCGLVITAIGYQAHGIEGVPYENGKVVNSDGRVKENLYVVGWAKRGPSGVIGTNKSDAAAVIELLVEDLKSPKNAGDISELLTHQVVVSQEHWQKINEAEVAAGEPKGKPRVKSVERTELLKHAGL
jgi:ferredoxin--NADP+ reductase